jgi:NAD(P)-dependent dehydrogenase (short-subunit alcohol dehydrogenase family)
MSYDFHGKSVVVTGAAMGIGKATSELFAERGAKVYGLDISKKHLEANELEWASKKYDIQAIQCDLTKSESVTAAFDLIATGTPKLDVLVNVAGVVKYGKIDEISESDWDFMLDTNLKGMFFTCRAAVPLMRANGGGSIINVSSVQAMVSQQTVAPYSASKGGVVSFTRSIALDYAKDGIRANSILPGSVETPMLRASGEQFSPEDPEGAMQKWGKQHPIGFLIQPVDIARVIAFLASDEARIITGAPIIADGGLSSQAGVQ